MREHFPAHGSLAGPINWQYIDKIHKENQQPVFRVNIEFSIQQRDKKKLRNCP